MAQQLVFLLQWLLADFDWTNPPAIFKSTMFQLKQASQELGSLCATVSREKATLDQIIAIAQKEDEIKHQAALRLMKNDARVSGMPLSSLDPADYGFNSPISPVRFCCTSDYPDQLLFSTDSVTQPCRSG